MDDVCGFCYQTLVVAPHTTPQISSLPPIWKVGCLLALGSSLVVPLLSSHHLSSSVLSSPPPHLSNTSSVTITEFDLERATVLLTWPNILAHCRCSAITGHLRNSAFCDKPFAPPTKPLQVNHHDLLHRLFKEHQVEELPWIWFICHLYDHRS